MSQDWIDDCIEFYGKVLTGKFAHWCPEWDGLPIDETCPEFKVCTCYSEKDMTPELWEEKLKITGILRPD